MKPPKDLTGKMRELFCEQEQQRHELMLQHCKERVSYISHVLLAAVDKCTAENYADYVYR